VRPCLHTYEGLEIFSSMDSMKLFACI